MSVYLDDFLNEIQESNIYDNDRQRKDQRIFKKMNKSDNFSIFEESKNFNNNSRTNGINKENICENIQF